MAEGFLPVNRQEMQEMGMSQVDFVYVCGDAYVDHPSFGHAIISRWLAAHGYTVGMLCQPDWRQEESIRAFGEPRLGFLVSAGNMDSMVNHYTVAGKRRRTDAYSPGGRMGLRPDRAVTVYGNLIRRSYKKTPVIIGGIEASLRRLGHYDYWSDQVRRSVLLESGADLISYGMGERSILEIADALDAGIPVSEITYVRGTVFKTRDKGRIAPDALWLPSFEEIRDDKRAYARSFYQQYCNTDPYAGRQLAETYGGAMYVVQNPAAYPLSTGEMDEVYGLPYQRTYHPSYEKDGGVPAIAEIRYSLTSSRGCFGGCNFCALTFHQGRIIQARSEESILREAEGFTEEKDFKGYIHDVGGPTADFRHPACQKQLAKGACPKRQCLFPSPCPRLDADHSDYIHLLRRLRKLPGVKKVFIRSGIRFDYVLADRKSGFLEELCRHHVSGQLKVAPEHVSDKVLEKMGKPRHQVYVDFTRAYAQTNQRLKKEQYLVPYLMSSHPGCTLEEAVKLAEYLRDIRHMPEQVQDFYPTPSTISTCMYYTGLDPRTMEPVYVPRDPHEKAMQRALMQYRLPGSYQLVAEALRRAGREDLIGYGPKCLIRPDGPQGEAGRRQKPRGEMDGRRQKPRAEMDGRRRKPRAEMDGRRQKPRAEMGRPGQKPKAEEAGGRRRKPKAAAGKRKGAGRG